MEQESIHKPIENGSNDDGIDRDSKRSNSYPSRTHRFAVAFVERIYQELGSSDFHSKEDIAKVHGLAVPSIKTTLSTAQQYGLLEIKHGVGYKVTALAIKIFHPENDSEKISSIVESLRAPDLFNELLNEFNNQVVPSQVGITNIIIRRYKFKSVVAERIAEIFIDNIKDYNLINPKNMLVLDNKTRIKNAEIKIQETGPAIDSIRAETKEGYRQNQQGIVDILIPLKGKRQAHLLIPEEYAEEDLDRIAKFVEALK
jgi:hypothetical protein